MTMIRDDALGATTDVAAVVPKCVAPHVDQYDCNDIGTGQGSRDSHARLVLVDAGAALTTDPGNPKELMHYAGNVMFEGLGNIRDVARDVEPRNPDDLEEACMNFQVTNNKLQLDSPNPDEQTVHVAAHTLDAMACVEADMGIGKEGVSGGSGVTQCSQVEVTGSEVGQQDGGAQAPGKVTAARADVPDRSAGHGAIGCVNASRGRIQFPQYVCVYVYVM